MELDNIKIGERIKSIRLNQGYTMEEFGKNFSTSKGTVNNWEKGRNLPNKENLLKIAKIGDTTVDELLYGNKRQIAQSLVKQELDKTLEIMRKDYGEEKINMLKANYSKLYEYASLSHALIADDYLNEMSIEELKNKISIDIDYILFTNMIDDESMIFNIKRTLNNEISTLQRLIGQSEFENGIFPHENINKDLANKLIYQLEKTIASIDKLSEQFNLFNE